MTRGAIALITCVLLGAAIARAQPDDTAQIKSLRVAPDERWESRGWMLLGSLTVDGKSDSQSMAGALGKSKFARLAIHVTGAELDLHDIVLTHADDRTYSPDFRHHFSSKSRTIVFDLPPERQLSRAIRFRYGAEKGGGKARLELWGLPPGAAAPPAPAVDPWSSGGWTFLGDARVTSGRGREMVRVRANQGSFTRLAIVIDGGDIDVSDARLKARGGPTLSVSVGHRFRSGATSREIELPTAQDRLEWIELRHANLPKKAVARVRIYGR
jgi:hypothetical protein